LAGYLSIRLMLSLLASGDFLSSAIFLPPRIKEIQ